MKLPLRRPSSPFYRSPGRRSNDSVPYRSLAAAHVVASMACSSGM